MDIRPHWTVTDPADEESTGPEARPNSAFLLGWYLDRKFSYDLSGTGGGSYSFNLDLDLI